MMDGCLAAPCMRRVPQRNWMWNGLDTSFRDQTIMMGDIHHYAWRAMFHNQTVYINPRDEAK